MGTNAFFKSAAPKITGSNLNLEARAIGAPSYGGRAAGVGAQKDVAAASALNKSKTPLQKLDRSAAYAKGPKV